jgi:hypothetical protein
VQKSVKAVLFSALLFPGAGHLVLKRRARGLTLVLLTLAALGTVVTIAVQRAMTVVDEINTGAIALDTQSIESAVEASGSGSGDLLGNACMAILVVCWVIGVVDSYRLGKRVDPPSTT